MRLSEFHIKMLWLVGLVLFCVVSFTIDVKHDDVLKPFMSFFKMFSVALLFVWGITLSWTLGDIVALKYKIIERSYQVEVRYLTFRWFFVPCWMPINETYHKYESQNLFGATYDSHYTNDVTYSDKTKAVEAIEKHRAEIKENRDEWFSRPEKEIKHVDYIF
jgi:hypothetical protein